MTSDVPIPTVDELNVRVDVCSATSATRDHGVGDQWHGLFALFHCTVRCDHEGKRYLGLVEERRRRWDGIEGRALVTVIGVGVRRRGDARIGWQPNLWRGTSQLARVGWGSQEIRGVEWQWFLAHAHLTKLIRQLVDRCRWGIIHRLLSESGSIDVLGLLWGRVWCLLLTGKILLGCEARGEELSSWRWLLLYSDRTVGGVRECVARAVIGLSLTSSVLATLRVGRGRGDRGSVCIHGGGWGLSWRFPLRSSGRSLCSRSGSILGAGGCQW